MLPTAVLCGGLARRLGAITASVPKSLVTICGEPFIAHQLRLLRERGITDAVLCVGHLGDMIGISPETDQDLAFICPTRKMAPIYSVPQEQSNVLCLS